MDIANGAAILIFRFELNHRWPMGLVVAGCIFILLSETVTAADWRFRPRITVRETYSDNINTSATDPESDLVTDISPGFTLNGVGRRFYLNIFYNLQFLSYLNDTSKDKFYNQFQLVSNGEVVEDLFFIDLYGSVRQSFITNLLSTPNSTISDTDNITNTYTGGVSPYLVHRFGSFMNGEARYTYDTLKNSSGNSDSQSHTALLNLTSGTQFDTFTWDTYYRYFRQIPEVGQDVTFERVQFNGRYQFMREMALLFGTGYEDNEFITLDEEDTTAVTWMAGLSWTPNSRTLIEGGAENRFFGVAPFLNAIYETERTALSFRYAEDVTTTNSIRSAQVLVPLTDPFGVPILDPNTGEVIQIPIDVPGIRNEVLVERAFRGDIALKGRRTTVGVNLYYTQRDYQISPNEDVYGGRFFVDRRLSRKSSVMGWLSATRSEFDSPTPNRTQYQVGVGVDHQFTKDFMGGIDAVHIRQDSDASGLDYDENRLTVMITKYF